jgi:hypothetical protein
VILCFPQEVATGAQDVLAFLERGDAMGRSCVPLLAALSFQGVLHRLADEFGESLEFMGAFVDNLFAVVPLDRVASFVVRAKTTTSEVTDMELPDESTEIVVLGDSYNCDKFVNEWRSAAPGGKIISVATQDEGELGTTLGTNLHTGTRVLGIAIGSKEYVRAHLEKLASATISDLNRAATTTGTTPDMVLTWIRQVAIPRLLFYTDSIPTDWIHDILRDFDMEILELMERTMGFRFSEAERIRMRLPTRMGGRGVVSLAEIAPARYLHTAAACLKMNSPIVGLTHTLESFNDSVIPDARLKELEGKADCLDRDSYNNILSRKKKGMTDLIHSRRANELAEKLEGRDLMLFTLSSVRGGGAWLSNEGGGELLDARMQKMCRLDAAEFRRMYLQTALGVNWNEFFSEVSFQVQSNSVVCSASSLHRYDGFACNGRLDFNGLHAMGGCRRFRHKTHEQGVRALTALARTAEMAPSRTHIDFGGKHKADVAVHGLTEDSLGVTTYLDVTVRNPEAISCPLNHTGGLDGTFHLRTANSAKRRKYGEMATAAGVYFIPVEISTFGVIGGGACMALGGISDRISKDRLISFSWAYSLARSALVGAVLKSLAQNLLRMDARIKQFRETRR